MIDDINRIYIASLKGDKKHIIKLPWTNPNKNWRKCLDTSDLMNIDLLAKEVINETYEMNENSLCVFIEQ